jgi:hypothetical protein
MPDNSKLSSFQSNAVGMEIGVCLTDNGTPLGGAALTRQNNPTPDVFALLQKILRRVYGNGQINHGDQERPHKMAIWRRSG